MSGREVGGEDMEEEGKRGYGQGPRFRTPTPTPADSRELIHH